MKCHGCGHEFPNTSARCPRCQRSTSRRGRTSTDSRLLEFPRRTRVAPPVESARPLPAWRVELNEKVRAIRANRGASDSTAEQPSEEIVKSPDSDARSTIVSSRQDDARGSYDRNTGARGASPRPESSQPAAALAGSGRRSSNNIVEAALTRVKRASENASRAALPKIEPARSIQTTTQGSLAVDRQATARALDPVPEIEPSVEYTPAPRPEVVQPPIIVPPPVIRPALAEAAIAVEPIVSATSYTGEVAQPAPILVLEEIEPLDYLEAEVRKVDKALGAEFLRNESPSVVTHAVISIVDLIAVSVSCSPFLAIVMIADGSFAIGATKLATGAMVGFIAFFYLALTQCLCGRTFGMMLTNTRVVDAQTFDAPSPSQALLRTAGYFIAAAPALIGILWTAFDYKHRGWQDFISRTMVVRDF
jgi:uncharacterized RDD family membrane protein YckC